MRTVLLLSSFLFVWHLSAQTERASNRLETEQYISDGDSDDSPTDTFASIDTTTCETYTVPSGDTTYATPGTYFRMDTIPNSAGSDSILSIDITIAEINTNVTYTSTTLTAELSGASYQWVSCPDYSIIGVATNQNFDPGVMGEYAVIIDNGTCIDTSECYSIDWAGIEENPLNTAIIYPNPSNGEFKINFTESFNGNIEIFSIEGRLVNSVQIQNKMEFDFRLNAIASGNYTLVFKTEEQISVKMITIQ